MIFFGGGGDAGDKISSGGDEGVSKLVVLDQSTFW